MRSCRAVTCSATSHQLGPLQSCRFQVLPLACAARFRFTGGWVRWFPINRYGCRGGVDPFRGRAVYISTLSKNKKPGSARNCTWFAGLRNRCSSAKASPAKSAAAPIRTEISRFSTGRYAFSASAAYIWGDQPDSNRYLEDHNLSCCLCNMAAVERTSNRRPGRSRTSINSLIRRVCSVAVTPRALKTKNPCSELRAWVAFRDELPKRFSTLRGLPCPGDQPYWFRA